MYRTPQQPDAPREDIERLEIARYTKAWRTFTVVLSGALLAPLAPVLVLGLSEHLPAAAISAGTGLTTLVMALTWMRQVVRVDANFTQGVLTVTAPGGSQQRVAFTDVNDVDTDSISDSELMRVTLLTTGGPVHVVDGMAVETTVEKLKAMRQRAARLAEEAAKARAGR